MTVKNLKYRNIDDAKISVKKILKKELRKVKDEREIDLWFDYRISYLFHGTILESNGFVEFPILARKTNDGIEIAYREGQLLLPIGFVGKEFGYIDEGFKSFIELKKETDEFPVYKEILDGIEEFVRSNSKYPSKLFREG
ncbi:MAG: hypothetical protein J7L43_00005 [Candidatus Aenigmarchaeota archaeon]|nr:hypothetical protein [Candidatus Aenigmarchaeota archaeon]